MYGLAAAQWELDEDRPAAHRQIQKARQLLRAAPPGLADGLPAIEQWLREHP
jgi:hypothetical protein